MRRSVLLAILVCVVGSGVEAAGQSAAQTPANPSLLAAAWRDDGVLVPFVKLDGGIWSPIWPEVSCGGGGADVVKGDSVDLSDVPSAWLGSGPTPIPLRWIGMTWKGPEELTIEPRARRVDAHCCGTWGLPVHGAPPPREHGETQGIALSSARGTRPFHELPADSAEARRLEKYLLPTLNEAEASALRTAANSKDEFQRYLVRLLPSRTEIRTGTPREVSLVAAESAQLGTLISFTVVRRYPQPSQAVNGQCGAVAILSGWLREARGGSLALLARHLDLTDCDAQEVEDRFPFALVEANGLVFILERRHGYEDESYAVLEVTTDGIRPVVEKNGGGC